MKSMVLVMVYLHLALAAPHFINPPPPSTSIIIHKIIRKRYRPNRCPASRSWGHNIHKSCTLNSNYSTYLLVSKGVCLLQNSHFHFVDFMQFSVCCVFLFCVFWRFFFYCWCVWCIFFCCASLVWQWFLCRLVGVMFCNGMRLLHVTTVFPTMVAGNFQILLVLKMIPHQRKYWIEENKKNSRNSNGNINSTISAFFLARQKVWRNVHFHSTRNLMNSTSISFSRMCCHRYLVLLLPFRFIWFFRFFLCAIAFYTITIS